MKLADDDRVVSVFPGWDDYELLLVTARRARASASPRTTCGRSAASAGSIRGIRLKGDDRVVGGCAVAHEEIVVIATDAGYAKRTAVDEFPVQARGGSGLKAAKIDKARGPLVAVAPAADDGRVRHRRRALVVPVGVGARRGARRRRLEGHRRRGRVCSASSRSAAPADED